MLIVVPVYRFPLFEFEEASLRQLMAVLGGRTIELIAPRSLEIAHPELSKLPVRRFDDRFFSGIPGYNELMLSREFYQAFEQYDYMLIYQLDCLVFRDELDAWCGKGFSYVGAPWFRDFASDAKAGLWMAGNGGLSLRHVPSFLAVYESRKLFYPASERAGQMEWFRGKPVLRSVLAAAKTPLHALGWRNDIRFALKYCKANEDVFWAMHAPRFVEEFRVPSAQEALPFAFECAPAFCYEQNGRRLPFGCHAWQKHDPEFWRPFLIPEAAQALQGQLVRN